jgi:hypothetical protein
MIPNLVLAACAIGAIGFFVWFISRPRISVRLGGGRAVVQRGQLPPGLLSELNDIARHLDGGAGDVQIRGTGATLKLTVRGLDEGPAQRVRNVVLLRRDRL